MHRTYVGLTTSFKEVVPTEDDPYWQDVREIAASIESDGCSGVLDFYLDACLEHDIHYRTHHWIDGSEIVKAEADRRFRHVIQSRSWFGVASPMSWWRWAAVALLGRRAWD